MVKSKYATYLQISESADLTLVLVFMLLVAYANRSMAMAVALLARYGGCTVTTDCFGTLPDHICRLR